MLVKEDPQIVSKSERDWSIRTYSYEEHFECFPNASQTEVASTPGGRMAGGFELFGPKRAVCPCSIFSFEFRCKSRLQCAHVSNVLFLCYCEGRMIFCMLVIKIEIKTGKLVTSYHLPAGCNANLSSVRPSCSKLICVQARKRKSMAPGFVELFCWNSGYKS